MTIHLIRSPELSREDFTAVYELLTAVSGTIQFRCDPNSNIDFRIISRRIKRAIEEAIDPDLAKHYYIQGGNGERKKIDYKHLPRI